jgi:hypothetical protein
VCAFVSLCACAGLLLLNEVFTICFGCCCCCCVVVVVVVVVVAVFECACTEECVNTCKRVLTNVRETPVCSMCAEHICAYTCVY